MRNIISLRHSCLIENNAVVMGTVMLGRLSIGDYVEDTSTILLLPCNPYRFVATRTRVRSSSCYLLDLGRCPFLMIFDINFGQEVIPIFMRQGTIVLLIILQLILNR